VRRNELADDARLALFAELAKYFRHITPFPEEAVHGLNDEQYVRNVVDCLYRAQTARQPASRTTQRRAS